MQQEFPTVLFASAFGHKRVDLFEIEDKEVRKAVKVKF